MKFRIASGKTFDVWIECIILIAFEMTDLPALTAMALKKLLTEGAPRFQRALSVCYEKASPACYQTAFMNNK